MNSRVINLDKVYNKILFGVLALVLVLANYLIFSKEYVLANGETMLLELAPRDPRSILQGDYMVLRYRLAQEIARHSKNLTGEGWVVVTVDKNNVARFRRMHESATTLSKEERLLYYRKRNGVVKIATNAFFFQEQHGKYYTAARYGELQVDGDGSSVLTGMRDKDFNKLSARSLEGM